MDPKKNKLLKFAINILLISLFLNSCTKKNDTIKDLINLDQNHTEYLSNIDTKKNHIPWYYQKIIFENFKRKYYSPWTKKRSHIKQSTLDNEYKNISSKKRFGENKIEIENEWFTKIKDNVNSKTFPNFQRYAITITNTNLRILPTSKPIFSGFTDDSNGFPFDIIQNSTIPANTPIYISHISKDKGWVLVESSYAHGWINIRDIAYAGPKFRKKFKDQSNFIAISDDDFPIKTFSGNHLYNGFIGMIFPLIKESKYNYHILTAKPSTTQFAYIVESVISKTTAEKMPVPLNVKNISSICNKLTNKPYGWGGLYNNRDCSAMIKDIYTPFGIWLPRNSTSQAKKGGLFIDLKNLDKNDKEDFIIKNATPYLTLLWFPGHIMLYIGEKDQSPIVFHNIWGIKTKDEKKRKIIGKSVITTLQPGEGLENLDKTSNFLNRIEAMTLIAPRYN